MASLTDGPAPPFDRLFHDCFAVLETRANALDDWNVQAFFARLYQSSHTFRRMLNHYYAKSPVGQRLWKLHFGGMPHHILGSMQTTVIQPRTLPSRNIEFPIKRDLANGEFMSASGKSPYNKEHVVLHEVIHALTDLKDLPIRRSSVNARLRMQLDRGPVVYLTDKILSEAGFSVEERVSYLDLAEGANDPRLQVAIHDTHMENLYLDPIVDRQRPPVTADTLVEEAPVKDRITVKQWQQMQRRLAAATGNKAIALLRQKFAERFKLLSSAGEGSSLDGAPLRRVTQVCDRFIRKSPTFRALVETMPEELGEGARPWDFVFDASAAPKNLATGNPLSGVDDFRKQIYLFDDHTSYLSERGLHHVEFERKIANAVIHAMTDLNVPKADLYKNRGAVVRLVDQVLAESGYYYPKQIVAALAAPSDSSRNMLRSQLTSARRSMAIEDAYIA